MEEIPEELKKFVPEIEDSDTDITKALYKVAFGLYPDEIEKLLRYYYFGFLLTNDDLVNKIEVSNIKIEKTVGKNGNPYWLKYKSLLAALGLDEEDGNTVDVIAY